ncbi:MAG: hypothetical protein KAT07_12175, partial [Calditrichia bacterium]|nr:hypothetical protein [Calditrichia bacterium]
MKKNALIKSMKNLLKIHLLNFAPFWIFMLPIFINSCMPPAEPVNDQFSYAQGRKDDLQLSIYITAHAV